MCLCAARGAEASAAVVTSHMHRVSRWDAGMSRRRSHPPVMFSIGLSYEEQRDGQFGTVLVDDSIAKLAAAAQGLLTASETG